ncbi:MAG: caspase family protein [Pseudomonadota bacterium]
MPCASPVAAQPAPKVEVVPISGHAGELAFATYSPDGMRVATSSWDGMVKLWDAATSRLIHSFVAGSDVVYSVAFSSDGRLIAAASGDRTVKVWDALSRELVHVLREFRDGASAVLFSRDGSMIVTASFDGTIKLWSVATGRLVRSWDAGLTSDNALSLSPDDRLIASTTIDAIKLWEMPTGRLARTIKPGIRSVHGTAFTPDGEHLVGAVANQIVMWHVASGALVKVFEGHAGDVRAVAASPDGALLASSGDDRTVRVWSMARGEEITSVEAGPYAGAVAFGADGKTLLFEHAQIAWIMDIESGQFVSGFQGVSLPVTSVAVTPDGSRALWVGGDGLVKMVDLANGQLARVFKGHDDVASVVSAASKVARAVSGGYDKSLLVWDLSSGEMLKALRGHESALAAVAMSPDGNLVISGDYGGAVMLWDATSGKLLRKLDKISGTVRAVAVSPDGKRLLSAGSDRIVKLWDAASGKLIRSFAGNSHFILAVAFSTDGKLVAAGTWDKPVKMWDAESGKLVRQLEGHSDYVGSLAFSPDGKQLITGSLDRSIKVWDLATGAATATLKTHIEGTSKASTPRLTGNRYTSPGEVGGIAVAFLADGKRIAAGSSDSSVRIWNIAKRTAPVTFYNLPDGEWLTMTDAGFFVASENGAKLLSVVHGLEVASIDQVYERLYSRTLVEELLKGDPEGRHKDAAHKLDLGKLIESGPAPQLDYLPDRTEKAGDTVRLAVRITDASGGIGRKLVWRVNGRSQGEAHPAELAAAPTGEPVIVATALKVDPGRANQVEVVAYNRDGLVASAPLVITVDKFGTTTAERPRMHVLAVGVDKYRMKDYELRYAVNDARRFAKALETVGSTLFSKVETTLLVNEEVSRERLAQTFARLAETVKPGGVFVLFLGGHGKSIAERYHFYPQALDFAAGETVETHGIGHDQWTQWLSIVPAEKTLLVFDTCESTAASGFVRGADSARETAMDLLQHATGRNVITAARNAAYEGYQGHGILTYALLQGLAGAAAQGQSEVRVGALAEYVTTRVPQITQSVFGVRQAPAQKVTGSFPLGIKSAAVAPASDGEPIPREPTHIVVKPAEDAPLRERAGEDAPEAERKLKPGDAVTVVRFEKKQGKDYALVARAGEKLGYLPADAVLKINK